MSRLDALRETIRATPHIAEDAVLAGLRDKMAPDAGIRAAAGHRAVGLVKAIRGAGRPGLMEVFLSEYGLSTNEGIALMCLAEALLRVPDRETIDDLIEDKIAPSEWGAHLGRSSSSLVNASTWALMLTGKVLKEDQAPGVATVLHGAVKRFSQDRIHEIGADPAKLIIGTVTCTADLQPGAIFGAPGQPVAFALIHATNNFIAGAGTAAQVDQRGADQAHRAVIRCRCGLYS
ncbi:MAG: hypothetical protein NWQ32_07340, partial [Paracoccaceae bacterium]|nr:hypothetical protein [Paracoccaceae bacterium]